ncbi:hypothetical protein [Sphingobacterium faecale]|uniref:Uncharacterized protein n=1 Tax=Sphingobacterium faecale TaxID=2803775 RepID=A0ABS1RBX1_9SPHI|nr:hypothetical protein [Sphingobacterium faecale]MBL1411517.1 hypothetical protein [Sphingobacterium faecale]
MISTLTPLQDAVEQQLSGSVGTLTKPSPPIDGLCAQALSEMASIYRQPHNHDTIVQDINQCYVSINLMLDMFGLYNPAHPYFQSIDTMLSRFELRYRHYIQPGTTLSLHRQEQLKKEVARRLPQITGKLIQKKINTAYLDELSYAMDSLFNSGKMPELCYAHLSYLPKLLDALKNMADDVRDKAWADRYIHLMIRFNFNHMGFFNRWKDEQDQLFEAALLEGTIADELIRLEAQLKQYSTNTEMAFCLQDKPLLNHMSDYLSIQKKRIKQRVGIDERTEQPPITLQLNGHQTKLLFHTFYAVGLFPVGTKEEIAKTVAPNIRTAADIQLSAQSLSKYDREKMINHAPYLIRKVKLMLEFLEQNFK